MRSLRKFNILMLVCFLVVCTVFCGCIKKDDEPKTTWQEQYDLGVRYLNESNYSEALIAFNMAIEIDPKRPEAYIGAADAYIGLERPEDAAAILQTGFDLTGDERIQVKLEQILGGVISDTGLDIEGENLAVTFWERIEDLKRIQNEFNGTPGYEYANYSGEYFEYLTDDELYDLFWDLSQMLEAYIEWVPQNMPELDENMEYDDSKVESRCSSYTYPEYFTTGEAYHWLNGLYRNMRMMDKCMDARNRAAEHFNDPVWNSENSLTTGEWTTVYDKFGRIIEEPSESYKYDDIHKTEWIIRYDGGAYKVFEYEYDSTGRLIKQTETAHPDNYVYIRDYNYDGNGKITIDEKMYKNGVFEYEYTRYITYDKYGNANFDEY